jgi:hypothetical protein
LGSHPNFSGNPPTEALFPWLISHQAAVLFSQNKSATSNQPTVLSLRTNQHQPSATSQTNRLEISGSWKRTSALDSLMNYSSKQTQHSAPLIFFFFFLQTSSTHGGDLLGYQTDDDNMIFSLTELTEDIARREWAQDTFNHLWSR